MSTEPHRGSAEHRARVEQQLSEYNLMLTEYEEGLKSASDQPARDAIENNIKRVKAELKELETELREINKGNR